MSHLTLQVPDSVMDVVRKWAEKENLSAEDYLSRKLAEAVRMDEAWQERLQRGKAVTRERFLEMLAKAPDVPPIPGDEID